jgi:N-methylhydantoinase A
MLIKKCHGGSGGGTIAFVGHMTGRLKVGPKSAGAIPGPASHSRDGKNQTVIDADMVVEYLNTGLFPRRECKP